MSRYLDGENLAPLTTARARALIGKRVVYLRPQDIDRSGRGYFFPRSGTVTGVFRGHIAMDYAENYIGTLRSIVELVLAPAESESANNNASGVEDEAASA